MKKITIPDLGGPMQARGLDRLQMSFDGKAYTHEKERQFLIVDEDYNKDKDMNTYYSIACDVMFTQMSAK